MSNVNHYADFISKERKIASNGFLNNTTVEPYDEILVEGPIWDLYRNWESGRFTMASLGLGGFVGYHVGAAAGGAVGGAIGTFAGGPPATIAGAAFGSKIGGVVGAGVGGVVGAGVGVAINPWERMTGGYNSPQRNSSSTKKWHTKEQRPHLIGKQFKFVDSEKNEIHARVLKHHPNNTTTMKITKVNGVPYDKAKQDNISNKISSKLINEADYDEAPTIGGAAGAATGFAGGTYVGATLGTFPGAFIAGGAVGGAAGAAIGGGIGLYLHLRAKRRKAAQENIDRQYHQSIQREYATHVHKENRETLHKLNHISIKHNVSIIRGKGDNIFIEHGPLAKGHHIAFSDIHENPVTGSTSKYSFGHYSRHNKQIDALGNTKVIDKTHGTFTHHNRDVAIAHLDEYLEGLTHLNKQKDEENVN